VIVFWIVAAAATVAALTALLIPLARRRGGTAGTRAEYDLGVYRDQLAEVERDVERGVLSAEQAEAARTEIKRRMLNAAPDAAAAEGAKAPPSGPGALNRVVMAAIAVVLPAGAVGLYLLLGSPGLPDEPFAERAQSQATAQASPHQMGGANQSVDTLVARLAERLRQNPDNLQGWLLLGRTYMQMARFDDAVDAFHHAVDLSKDDMNVAVDYAEALVQASGGTVVPEAHQLFEAALKDNPGNIQARYYLGVEKAQQGDLRGALQSWVDVVSIAPPGAPWLADVKDQTARLAKQGGVDLAEIKPSPELAGLVHPPVPSGAQGTAPPATAAAVPPAGEPAVAPPPSAAAQEAAAQMTEKERQDMIRTMVQRLADRLKENPNDREGWLRLARAYEVLGEADKAKEAHAKAAALAKP